MKMSNSRSDSYNRGFGKLYKREEKTEYSINRIGYSSIREGIRELETKSS
jgi:hypothetical protein